MITILHNPDCGTSRVALAIARASGDAADGLTVIEYLRDPPARDRLAGLIAAAGLAPREALRVKGNEALLARHGLDPETAADDAVLDAMTADPILINRPLVETPEGTILARPAERVAAVLRDPPPAWTKEDGTVVDLGAWR